jgi:GDP-L-fucose synthase
MAEGQERDLVGSTARIYLAGHTGLVGGAILRGLRAHGYEHVIFRTHEELDLTDQAQAREFFRHESPEIVIVAAARVGGILANWEYPYEFVQQNLAIELNAIHEAFRAGVRRLIFLGSSCIYPKLAPQPLREDYLLTCPLEETNRPYAIAKIAGIELCRSLNREYGTDYLSLMPTNLYGPGDNFDLETSHLLPALIRKFHEARRGTVGTSPVKLWGTGTPRRELLYVDDLAAAVCHLLQLDDWTAVPDGLLNV